MATSLISPGVEVREIDLTTIVPSVTTTEAAIAGVFRWGPTEQRVLIDSETQLVNRFGKPTNFNPETFFTAASFLAYGNRLYVTRAANTEGLSGRVTVNVEESNGVVVLSSGNTANLQAGMYLVSSSGGGLDPTARIATGNNGIINSTAFNLSQSSDAIATTTDDVLFFVTNTVFTAIANTGAVETLAEQIVKSEAHFLTRETPFDTDVKFVARYPGELGNSLKVSICGNSSGYTSVLNLASFGANVKVTFTPGSNVANLHIASDTAENAAANATAIKTVLNVTDRINVGNVRIGTQQLLVTSFSGNIVEGANVKINIRLEDRYTLAEEYVFDSSNTSLRNMRRYWEHFNLVDEAPGQSDHQIEYGNSSINSDEMHIVVTDQGGKITGIPGTVLEVYRAVSRATDSKRLDGAQNYWKEVINDSSQYIYAVGEISGAPSNTAENLISSTLDVVAYRMQLGRDGPDENTVAHRDLTAAYDMYRSAEDVDVSLILTGKARDFQLPNYLIDNIAEIRKDCVVMVSPQKGDVVNNLYQEADAIVTFRNVLRSTSYAVLDSGYKYMYDRYNDLYRWIPLNGDVAGLCVRTDSTNDPWYSPAGYNRGQIKNIIRLAFNPRQSERDTLYKSGVNPVVTFPGQGTVLFGDKTLLAKPSAFDRINVRRLFIVLEKAIAKASKYTLFEFNDEFTRLQFKNLVVPYLRDVQGRRGITDFLVVCDETNNTPDVIDRNEFIGDIYIKPARSINFIQLNFVAVRTGVAFSEVIGRF